MVLCNKKNKAIYLFFVCLQIGELGFGDKLQLVKHVAQTSQVMYECYLSILLEIKSLGLC